jgi:hypothetical protein
MSKNPLGLLIKANKPQVSQAQQQVLILIYLECY